MESSKPEKEKEKKHKKKQKKEKHKKSSKSKKEKKKKKHRSSSESSNDHHTPPPPVQIKPPTINLDDDEDPSIEEIETTKEIFSKLVGKREAQENGAELKNKKPKLISTDPDELVNIIKRTIETTQIQSTVVSSASDSEGYVLFNLYIYTAG